MSQKNINGDKKMSIFRGVWFTKIDPIIIEWMSRNGYLLVRISIGIVFVWIS